MSVIKPYGFHNIWTPGKGVKPKTFRDLIEGLPGGENRMRRCFENTLARSFKEDEKRQGTEYRKRIQTQAEMARRAQIMGRWFRRLRGDLGYTVAKIEVVLGQALRAELDGQTFEPPPSADKGYGIVEGES